MKLNKLRKISFLLTICILVNVGSVVLAKPLETSGNFEEKMVKEYVSKVGNSSIDDTAIEHMKSENIWGKVVNYVKSKEKGDSLDYKVLFLDNGCAILPVTANITVSTQEQTSVIKKNNNNIENALVDSDTSISSANILDDSRASTSLTAYERYYERSYFDGYCYTYFNVNNDTLITTRNMKISYSYKCDTAHTVYANTDMNNILSYTCWKTNKTGYTFNQVFFTNIANGTYEVSFHKNNSAFQANMFGSTYDGPY